VCGDDGGVVCGVWGGDEKVRSRSTLSGLYCFSTFWRVIAMALVN
jgi:hypothetical protein